jgi:hypothetical protein
VGVAQLVERQTVDLDVAGSNPVTHPNHTGCARCDARRNPPREEPAKPQNCDSDNKVTVTKALLTDQPQFVEDRGMSLEAGNHAGPQARGEACRLVIRKEKGFSEILQFVAGGLEIGQQVVILAGPTCLQHIARNLTESGLKTEAMLHSGRLVFLTAPNCLADLLRPSDPLQRSPLRRQATVMRWITDWSWAYGNGSDAVTIRDYQRGIHEFIRPFNAISMCTVHCEKVERSNLLAMLVDHRRVAKTIEPVRRAVYA